MSEASVCWAVKVFSWTDDGGADVFWLRGGGILLHAKEGRKLFHRQEALAKAALYANSKLVKVTRKPKPLERLVWEGIARELNDSKSIYEQGTGVVVDRPGVAHGPTSFSLWARANVGNRVRVTLEVLA